jgi:cell fate regulator YaaT (PSP1 superfamily)
MVTIIGVKFKTSAKAYYFDPKGIAFDENDGVIVETSRGIEFGLVTIANKDVAESEIVPPLKPILRKATEEDAAQNQKNLSERGNIISGANDRVRKHNLKMKVTDAEYTFDRAKIIVYFTAEQRVDFRELVKDLASLFRVRIELRQIYERERAEDNKLKGAVGMCGRTCCCIAHKANHQKVSIKMAKVQGLSLSPGKISGCCGKFMCCLKYEYPYYQETYKLMPKVGSTANSPSGNGTVVSHDILKQTVKMRLTNPDGGFEDKTFKLCQVNCRHKQSEDDE